MKRSAGVSLVLAVALAGCAGTTGPRVASLPPGAHYVAMGSSYAAGAGIGTPKPGTPQRCFRSASNYPTLLAARLALDLDDQTCGGAVTENILGAWNELPPQIAAVTPDTRLVTITIGGNDVDFVRNLFLAGVCPALPSAPASCPRRQVKDEAGWEALDGNLRRIVRGVHDRAPHARVLFVDYVTVLPAGEACERARLAPEDAAIARVTALRLAALTAKVAHEEGAEVLAASALSRNHTACDAEPWSNAAAPAGAARAYAPWHPNAAGHAGIAAALAKRLRG